MSANTHSQTRMEGSGMITDALLHQCSTIDVNTDMFFALDSSVLNSLGALELGSRALQDQFMLQFYDANQHKQNYHLNHGSYGAVPKLVLLKQFEMQMWMETHPDRWFRQRSFLANQTALKYVAKFVNSAPENMVFLTNATLAMNVMFHSVPLCKDDTVLCFDIVYPAVRNALAQRCLDTGAHLLKLTCPFPLKSEQSIIDLLEQSIQSRPAGSIKLLCVDHVAWSIACVFPIQQISALCKHHGIVLCVDGAHAIGQVELDLTALDVDFYTSNFHKWAFGPKGSAFLYFNSKHIKHVQSLVVGHEWLSAPQKQFWMQGTRDESAFLAAAAGVQFLESLGTNRCRAYMRDMVQQAATLFERELGCERIAPLELNASLVVLRLPLKDSETAAENRHTVPTSGAMIAGAQGSDDAPQLRQSTLALVDVSPSVDGPRPIMDSQLSRGLMNKWMNEHNLIAALFSYDGHIYVRLSAQIYNTIDDYQKLVDLVKLELQHQ